MLNANVGVCTQRVDCLSARSNEDAIVFLLKYPLIEYVCQLWMLKGTYSMQCSVGCKIVCWTLPKSCYLSNRKIYHALCIVTAYDKIQFLSNTAHWRPTITFLVVDGDEWLDEGEQKLNQHYCILITQLTLPKNSNPYLQNIKIQTTYNNAYYPCSYCGWTWTLFTAVVK